jgi:hypothetical protein
MAVVMTLWRRPGYTRKALRSWDNVRWTSELHSFTAYIDPSDRQDEIVSACEESEAVTRVVVNPERYGVSCNPEFSMKRGFDSGAKFVIIADDDMLVSEDILEYFQWAASEFENQDDVAGVCAHTPEPTAADSAVDEVRLLSRYRCWVWGTWRDRFENVFEPNWDEEYSSGEPAGYDWNYDLRVIPGLSMTCAFPLASRSQNIGRFEGVHAGPADYQNTVNPSFREKREPVGYRLVTE